MPAPPPKMVNGVSSNNSNSNKPRLVPGQSPTKSVNNSSTTEISQNNGQNGQKSQNGFKMAEIYTNNHFDHEGGTSVDDSDEDDDDPPPSLTASSAASGRSTKPTRSSASKPRQVRSYNKSVKEELLETMQLTAL